MTLCIIYKLTNIVNKKIYIGQTWSSMLHRFGQHLTSKRCVKLYNALKKYGKEKFIMECITVANTQEIANYLEVHFIDKFNSIKQGYNIREGGSRGKLSEETKRKISCANIGRKHTDETKLKNSIAHKGKPGPNKGKIVPLSSGAGTPKGTKPWNTGTKGIIVPWNKDKKQFPVLSLEQELLIVKDERSSRLLAKEYGVSKSLILNIRKRHKE